MALPRLLPFGAGALLLASAVIACGSNDPAAKTVKVVGSNSACTPDVTELGAGATSFEFRNDADEISELYVLKADGSVAGEVEDVTTGSTKKLKADLVAGEYKLTCKPGQKGNGYSATIRVTGGEASASATGEPRADRTARIVARDFRYEMAPLQVKQGETITFELVNQGTMQHEMEVLTADGTNLGEIGPTDAGKSASVTLTFDRAGSYVLNCGIDDHEARGMHMPFEVAAA